MPVGEFPALVQPHPLPAGEAVQQNHGRAAAADPVRHVDITDPDTDWGYAHCSELLPNLFMRQDSAKIGSSRRNIAPG
jgi:hypothetical protein